MKEDIKDLENIILEKDEDNTRLNQEVSFFYFNLNMQLKIKLIFSVYVKEKN